MKNFLNIELEDLKINTPKCFFCFKKSPNFIFSSSKGQDIIAHSNVLLGEIIQVINEVEIDNQVMSEISLDNSTTGWTQINTENFVRVYRTPNIQGKVSSESNVLGYKMPASHINKILKVDYIFFIKDAPYLMIKKLGDTNYLPIPLKSFHKLSKPQIKTDINISENTVLYKDSNLEFVEGKLMTKQNCQIVNFFEKTDIVRIKSANKLYWIEYDHNIETTNNTEATINYDLLDTIMYLKKVKSNLQYIVNLKENSLKQIRDNIIVSNDFQKLYLNKYAGEKYELK